MGSPLILTIHAKNTCCSSFYRKAEIITGVCAFLAGKKTVENDKTIWLTWFWLADTLPHQIQHILWTGKTKITDHIAHHGEGHKKYTCSTVSGKGAGDRLIWESWTHRDWMENSLCSSSSRNPQDLAENKLQPKIKRKNHPKLWIGMHSPLGCTPLPPMKQERRRSCVADVSGSTPRPPSSSAANWTKIRSRASSPPPSCFLQTPSWITSATASSRSHWIAK
jgi:hypothetical protein